METKILVTLGHKSLNKQVIKEIEIEFVYLFRINLSHTQIDTL